MRKDIAGQVSRQLSTTVNGTKSRGADHEQVQDTCTTPLTNSNAKVSGQEKLRLEIAKHEASNCWLEGCLKPRMRKYRCQGQVGRLLEKQYENGTTVLSSCSDEKRVRQGKKKYRCSVKQASEYDKFL